MELKDLKRSLFGFNRSSVFEYIAELNRLCSVKVDEAKREKNTQLAELAQKNEELNNRLTAIETDNDALKKQISEAEALIAELKAQNESIKNDFEAKQKVETEVAEILSEARAFAVTLKEKAVAENEAFKLQNRLINEAETKRLAEYSQNVSEIGKAINSILERTRDELKKAESDISALECKSHE